MRKINKFGLWKLVLFSTESGSRGDNLHLCIGLLPRIYHYYVNTSTVFLVAPYAISIAMLKLQVLWSFAGFRAPFQYRDRLSKVRRLPRYKTRMPISVRRHLYVETAPGSIKKYLISKHTFNIFYIEPKLKKIEIFAVYLLTAWVKTQWCRIHVPYT